MNRYILFIALMICVLLAMCQKAAFGNISANEQNAAVKMTITKLQVNDQTLDLSWKITNGTDHDVWFCAHEFGFDTYMAKDNRTLVIRKRFDLPISDWLIFERPWIIRGLYLRLGPGQEHTESESFNLPVDFDFLFEVEPGNAERAVRLALEIGFFDEDLRSMILQIVEMAEKLDCTGAALGDLEIYGRFFGGLWVAGHFNGSTYPYFRESVNSGDEEILIPPMGQVHLGEQVLRASIDGVCIPYRGLQDAYEPQSESEPVGVTTVLTKFDVNDTNLKMDYKIVNNTDHDIWICDRYVDKFMETDNRTLVLRTRYNLSNEGIIWEFPFPRFRYSRLRPGNKKIESISLDFPVKPDALFKTSRGNAEYAKRLVIEIGYYDEDLRALILDIVEIAEKLNCDGSAISPWDPNSTLEIYHRFFGGVEIAGLFNSEGSTYFRDSVTSGGDEIITPYLKQTLNGEKVLRIEVDNVSIPYESRYPPLTSQGAKSRQTNSSGPDNPGREKPSDRNSSEAS